MRLSRGLAGKLRRHRAVARALGLRRVGQVAEHDATPSVLGMCHAIRHLVEVSEAKGAGAPARPKPRPRPKPRAKAKKKKA